MRRDDAEDCQIQKWAWVGLLNPTRPGDEGGIETELAAYSTEQAAKKVMDTLLQVHQDPTVALQAVAALLQICDIALRIAIANDQQGTPGYATKSHMSKWGDDIFDIANSTLALVGLEQMPK